MKWLQITIGVIILLLIVYVISYEIISTIKQNREYQKKYKNWNNEHPALQRRLCKTCKYSIKETYYIGKYRHSLPTRKPEYCTLLKRKIDREESRCLLAEPQEYFYEPKGKKELFPKSGTAIYYSAYGNCYHSTPHCRSIKNSRNVYKSCFALGRYPCPKCWKEENGNLVAK